MRRIVPDPYGLLKGEGVNALRAVCTRPRQTGGIGRSNSRRGNEGQRGTHSDGVLHNSQAYTEEIEGTHAREVEITPVIDGRG